MYNLLGYSDPLPQSILGKPDFSRNRVNCFNLICMDHNNFNNFEKIIFSVKQILGRRI